MGTSERLRFFFCVWWAVLHFSVLHALPAARFTALLFTLLLPQFLRYNNTAPRLYRTDSTAAHQQFTEPSGGHPCGLIRPVKRKRTSLFNHGFLYYWTFSEIHGTTNVRESHRGNTAVFLLRTACVRR